MYPTIIVVCMAEKLGAMKKNEEQKWNSTQAECAKINVGERTQQAKLQLP